MDNLWWRQAMQRKNFVVKDLVEKCGMAVPPRDFDPIREGTWPAMAHYANFENNMFIDQENHNVYLYVVLENGYIAYVPQIKLGTTKMGRDIEKHKHPMLTGGNVARIGGEIARNINLGCWVANADSGRYSKVRTGVLSESKLFRTCSNLDAAIQLMVFFGINVDVKPDYSFCVDAF